VHLDDLVGPSVDGEHVNGPGPTSRSRGGVRCAGRLRRDG
jgi:hypothetical protein